MLVHRQTGIDGADQQGSGGPPEKPAAANPLSGKPWVALEQLSISMTAGDNYTNTNESIRMQSEMNAWPNFPANTNCCVRKLEVPPVTLERTSGRWLVDLPWVRWHVHGSSIAVLRPTSLPRRLFRRLRMGAADARYSVVSRDSLSPVRIKEGDVIEVSTQGRRRYYTFRVHTVDADTGRSDKPHAKRALNFPGKGLRLLPGDNVEFKLRQAPEMLAEPRQLADIFRVAPRPKKR